MKLFPESTILDIKHQELRNFYSRLVCPNAKASSDSVSVLEKVASNVVWTLILIEKPYSRIFSSLNQLV